MSVEELMEKLAFCEPEDELKLKIVVNNNYILADIDDLEVYDGEIYVVGKDLTNL